MSPSPTPRLIFFFTIFFVAAFSHVLVGNTDFEKAEKVFSEHCHSCHSSSKKKGAFRLDLKELAYKGGETEELSIIPGKPLESSVIKRMLLPLDDEEVMPPRKKARPTEAELNALKTWIQKGAIWPDETKEVKEKTYKAPKNLLANIEKFKNSPIRILPSAWKDDGLDVNISHIPFSPKLVSTIKAIRNQIVTFDLGRTQYTEKLVPHLKTIPNLDILHLNKSNITDKILASLGHVPKLRILNLYQTNISDKSIPHLLKLPSLEKIYLDNTKVTKKGILRLEKRYPHLKIYSKLVEKKALSISVVKDVKKETPPEAEQNKKTTQFMGF